MKHVKSRVSELPIELPDLESQPKQSIFNRRNFYRMLSAAVVSGALTYAGLSIEHGFKRRKFESEEELLQAINEALGEEIEWEHVYVQQALQEKEAEVQGEIEVYNCNYVQQDVAGTTVTRKKKSTDEIVEDQKEAERWKQEDSLDWLVNFQNKYASDKDCNDHAATVADALHDVGIEVLYVSLRPALTQDDNCSRHQVAVVKMYQDHFALFDNSKRIMVHGSLEQYFLAKDRPMEIMEWLDVGVAKARRPYFDNFASRGVALLHNRVALEEVRPMIRTTRQQISTQLATNQ